MTDNKVPRPPFNITPQQQTMLEQEYAAANARLRAAAKLLLDDVHGSAEIFDKSDESLWFNYALWFTCNGMSPWQRAIICAAGIISVANSIESAEKGEQSNLTIATTLDNYEKHWKETEQ